MKLTMKWGGKSQRPKACRPPQKVRWNLLGIPDPGKVPPPVPIEEIRRQAQAISSRAIDQGTRSRTEEREKKKNSPTKACKAGEKSTRGSKAPQA